MILPNKRMHWPPKIKEVASRLVLAVPNFAASRPATRGVQVLLTEYEAKMMLKSTLLEPISLDRRVLIGPKNSLPLFYSFRSFHSHREPRGESVLQVASNGTSRDGEVRRTSEHPY